MLSSELAEFVDEAEEVRANAGRDGDALSLGLWRYEDGLNDRLAILGNTYDDCKPLSR
jgi:hypothetical protein